MLITSDTPGADDSGSGDSSDGSDSSNGASASGSATANSTSGSPAPAGQQQQGECKDVPAPGSYSCQQQKGERGRVHGGGEGGR